MPKLSIITINHNNREGLSKTIESVVNQTFQDYEYIIIDGGSNDGTLEEIKNNRHKIKKWISEKDSGIYNAMNKGINNATGEYCLFLNSGDYLYSLNVLDAVFSKSPSADLICCLMNIEEVDGSNPTVYSVNTERINNRYIFIQSLPHPSTFIKRDLFNKHGLYDESLKIAGDYDFFVRAIKGKATFEIYQIILSSFNKGGISYRDLDLVSTEQMIVQKKYYPVYYLFHSLLNRIKK